MTVLEARGVSKAFGRVAALRSADLRLEAGEVHGLLGENGAGKSTLVGILTGLQAPDSGVVAVGGQPVGRLTPVSARALGIACIHQQPALVPDLSVAENLALRLDPPRALGRVRRDRWRSRALDLLARAGGGMDPDTEAGALPLPLRQRVEIACALGSGARVLLMDEPTASLARPDQQRLLALVRSLRAAGVAILYISHRLEEVAALADRVTVLRDGATVATLPAGPGRSGPDDVAGWVRRMIDRDPPTRQAVGPVAVDLGQDPGAGLHGPPVVLGLRGVGCRAAGVRDVSMDLPAGRITGLAGLVGSGRTGLARILAGLDPADEGTLELDGRRIHPRTPAEAIALGIACLPEDRRRHGVIGGMTVAANLALACPGRVFPGGWLRARAERALAGHWIEALSIRTPGPSAEVGTLSGGNQQKVALGRWLATSPRVLVLDEPTQGVDVGAKAEIHRIIRDLAASGMAILLISSDLPELLSLSDHLHVFRGGRCVAGFPGGSPADLVMAAALGVGTTGGGGSDDDDATRAVVTGPPGEDAP